jgi:hypothetical protein
MAQYGTSLSSTPFDDRRNEPWPWYSNPAMQGERDFDQMNMKPGLDEHDPDMKYTPTLDAFYNSQAPWRFDQIEQTPMGVALGLNDIKRPTREEVLKYIIENSFTEPYTGPVRQR